LFWVRYLAIADQFGTDILGKIYTECFGIVRHSFVKKQNLYEGEAKPKAKRMIHFDA
jgi:hypothetical protein